MRPSGGGRMTHINNQASVSNQAVTQYIYGGAYFGSHPPPPSVTTPDYNLGIRLGHAPQIDEDDFIGRERELEQLQTWLAPQPGRQNVVSLSGLGGMGKTQLSIHLIKRSGSQYSSVFWLNAKDENTLKAGLAALAIEVTGTPASPALTDTHNEERLAQQARQWLSQRDNDKWLIVYDNYDDPRIPGVDSSTGYDIHTYFPERVHGSILITTRSPRLLFAKQLRLTKLVDIKQSLAILAARSGRKVDGDTSVMRLAQRLDGLPLALATAGAYLSQSADSFDDYLQLYNSSWTDLSQYSSGPVDYEERTLYSTWTVSFERVRDQDPVAAELLKLMAYLDNQDLWYELFQAGARDPSAGCINEPKGLVKSKQTGTGGVPAWWVDVLKSRARFNRAISTLHNYSLLEVSEGRYSLHTCVHDWTLEYLNYEYDWERCAIAIRCVAASVSWESEADYWVRNRRVLPHARRFQHVRFKVLIDWSRIRLRDLDDLAEIYWQNNMNVEADEMFLRALRGYEKARGPEHTSTLNAVNNLGIIYAEQGKMVEAEKMYMRALRGYEKARGPEHTSTLDAVHNLGILYAEQGKMVEAEEMLLRALRGKEKAWGPEHTSTLDAVNNLGILYTRQGKMVEAEEMLLRALRGYEKVWGPEHTSTLEAVNNLGNLYTNQGKMVEAEEMLLRALRGSEKARGPEHTSTLDTVNNLGFLYTRQGKMVEAEEMLLRVLRGYEKAWGPEHTSTLEAVNHLGNLYTKQGKTVEAEEMLLRALAGNEKARGPSHTLTIIVVINYGTLSCQEGRLAEAEKMYQRALTAMVNAFGPEHPWTLGTVNNIGNLRCKQGTLLEAEQMYQRALTGLEKMHGPAHVFVPGIANNLGVLFAERGKHMESKQMYHRALDGFRHACGAEHPNTVMVVNNLSRLALEVGEDQPTNIVEATPKPFRRRWYY